MNLYRTIAIPIILIAVIIITAGCTSPSHGGNETSSAQPAGNQIAASYKVTISQPDAMSAYIHADTDIYNIGEVVEFTVINDGSRTLDCAGDPPSFSVKYQGINGAWVTRMGYETPDTSKKSSLAPGASTTTYRFITTGWDPGRYRIVHDCGVVREFILRPIPAPAATPGEPVSVNGTVNMTVAPPTGSLPSPATSSPANNTGTIPFNTPGLPSTSSGNSGTPVRVS
jgi:hypothetical protein